MVSLYPPPQSSVLQVTHREQCTAGMLFGRHQLIKLSPKKTVEGFVGAFFVTVIFAVAVRNFSLSNNFDLLLTRDPRIVGYSLHALQFHDLPSSRSLDQRFLQHSMYSQPRIRMEELPSSWISHRCYRTHRKSSQLSLSTRTSLNLSLFSQTRGKLTSIPWAPFQLHSIVLATFASLVAPFGGFFASGFKRAFNIKDFGDSIPGHGGMTDRMDCQFLMGLFSYV